MNTDYIKSLLIMFNNKSVYEIETALAIYEFMEKAVIEEYEDANQDLKNDLFYFFYKHSVDKEEEELEK